MSAIFIIIKWLLLKYFVDDLLNRPIAAVHLLVRHLFQSTFVLNFNSHILNSLFKRMLCFHSLSLGRWNGRGKDTELMNTASSCVALDRLHDFSETQFSCLKTGNFYTLTEMLQIFNIKRYTECKVLWSMVCFVTINQHLQF